MERVLVDDVEVGRAAQREAAATAPCSAQALVYHIRRQLKPPRGNQFYRDRSDRYNGTYCGSEATHFDVSWKEKAVTWDACGMTHQPCAECVSKRGIS